MFLDKHAAVHVMYMCDTSEHTVALKTSKTIESVYSVVVVRRGVCNFVNCESNIHCLCNDCKLLCL